MLLAVGTEWRDGAGRDCAGRFKASRMRHMTTGKPLISVVSPVYEEEEVLPHFHRVLGEVLDGLADHYNAEIILWTTDCATVRCCLLREMAAHDSRVRFFSFSRNFGHQAAVTAGLENARGDAVVTLDCDLQHPPSLIPVLVQKVARGIRRVATVARKTAPSCLGSG